MTDLATLSAAKLHALIVKREAVHSALLNEVIAAGYGSYTGNQLRELVKTEPYPLLVEHLAAEDARYAAHAELESRKRYQGNDRPIKRKVW